MFHISSSLHSRGRHFSGAPKHGDICLSVCLQISDYFAHDTNHQFQGSSKWFLPQGLCTHCSLTPIPTHLPRTLFLLVFTRLAPSQLLGLNEKVVSLERLFLQLYSLKRIPPCTPSPRILFISFPLPNKFYSFNECMCVHNLSRPPSPPRRWSPTPQTLPPTSPSLLHPCRAVMNPETA